MLKDRRDELITLLPGIMVCVVIALAATFCRALRWPTVAVCALIGLFPLSHHPSRHPQRVDCGRTVLRGVALLGARITVDQISGLGIQTAIVVTMALVATIGFGMLMAHWLKRPAAEGLLSGGAVAICGASAALAISSVLPQSRENERFTLLVVVGVTVMSTMAMVIYPFTALLMALAPQSAGIFLGGTIHDVAQVVAAGMMLGPQAGDTATVVKLFRVILLMPVVMIIVIAYRHDPGVALSNERVALIPGFLLVFIVLVLLASVGMIQPPLAKLAGETSRGFLVCAIAASGIKTSFEDLVKLGWQPVSMLVAETLFIAGLVLAAVLVLGWAELRLVPVSSRCQTVGHDLMDATP